MSNKSKFLKIQEEICEIAEPEVKPIDRVCPTCIPDPNFVTPEWWKETSPWLNQKTCEYSVAVFVNQDGKSYRLSDLRDILDPPSDMPVVLSEAGVPVSTPASGITVEEEKQAEIINEERFDRIKRSFVKTGIRQLLRQYQKTEANEYICARNDCSIFTTSEVTALSRQIRHFASLNLDISFSEFQLETDQVETLPKPIDNPNALELFASATEYYFYGMADNVMAVLVTVPAHIFDQVPDAPLIPDLDVDIESIRVKVPEFTTWIAKMESLFVLFAKFQSYYNHTENGKLFHVIDDEETPFYAKLMQGRFEKFETALSQFLESKGYEYYNLLNRLISFGSDNTVEEIEFLFDKSDETRPYKLANKIIIKTPKCTETELKLPEEPNIEDGVLPTGNDIRTVAFTDQTLMTYIAFYEKIKTQIDAQENPPWLDFLVEHTFPPLSVNYGDTLNSKSNALGCLLDKFSGLDDYLLNETMSFFDSFAYRLNKNNCRSLRNRDKGKPTVFNDDKQQKNLEKAQKEQRKRTLKEKGILEDKKVKETKNSTDLEQNGVSKFLNMLSPCNWRKITLKGVQCLMSGMTIDEGYRELMKATVGALSTEGMELLIESLPIDKQRAVREKIQNEFRDLPAPWEVGYDPGDTEAVYESAVMKDIQASQKIGRNIEEVFKNLEQAKTQLQNARGVVENNGEPAIARNQELYLNYLRDLETAKEVADRRFKLYNDLLQASNSIQMALNSAEEDYKMSLEPPKVEYMIAQAAESVATFRVQYRKMEEELVPLKAEYDAANAAYTKLFSNPVQPMERSQIIEKYKTAVIELEAKVLSLQYEYKAAESAVSKDLQKSPNNIGFDSLTEEQKRTVIEQEKDKKFFVQGGDADKIRQGTYGKAVGNVQKELLAAYGQAILDTASVQEIIEGVNNLPGAKLIGEFFASFDCPSYQFAKPPIDEFLGTFTIGACGKGKTKPFLLPEIKSLKPSWDIWDALKEAFVFAFKKTMSQIVSALILKAIQALEAGVCQALSVVGESATDLITAAENNGRFPRSFSEILSDVVCGDELNENEKDDEVKKLFAAAGAPPRGNTTPKEVLETMSTLGSEQDYLKAMVGLAEPGFLDNVSRTLSLIHPEYSSLGTPDGLNSVLQNAGNFFTEDQRERAINFANNPQQFFPLDPSICLTNDQADRYYNNLRNMFANQIGDPEIAQQFVDNQRQNARDDLAGLADIMARGPEGHLQDAINDLLGEPDPDCALSKSLLKTPEEIQKEIESLTKGIFGRLQLAFTDDTIEENMAERFFSAGLADSIGTLLMITADSVGYNYAKHMRVRNSFFFRFLSTLGFFDNEAPFPETIANQMRKFLLDYNSQSTFNPDGTTNTTYAYDLDKSQFFLDYENGLEKFERFTSDFRIKETMRTNINNSFYHNPDFNYQFRCNFLAGVPTDNNKSSVQNFVVERLITQEQLDFIKTYRPNNEELYLRNQEKTIGSNTFRNIVFRNYLQEKVNLYGDITVADEDAFMIIKDIKDFLNGPFMKSILNDENGGPSNGFLHGAHGDRTITLDDLTYVDPDPGATEYTYSNEDAVLGRSLTNNPRVKFLDPTSNGGSYESPMIYLEPQEANGFMSFAKIIVPNIDGCEPRGTNFLELKELEDKISEKESKIKRNEKLSESPECVVEVPFDKVASPATLATLEQIVTATIRVYLTEFMINSFPIHGSLSFNNLNYDELVSEYIYSKMQQGLSDQFSLFATTYEGYTYWLLFLEQCAQAYNRKVQLGEVEVDLEAQQAMDAINQAQIDYTKPTRDTGALFENDFIVSANDGFPKTIKEFLDIGKQQFDDVYAYPAVGGYLVAQNTRRWDKTFKPGFFATNVGDTTADIVILRGGLDDVLGIPIGGFRYWTQAQMNFSAKIATIAENEHHAAVFLKRLIREQIDVYSDKIALQLTPRPFIYDVNKFFIGGSQSTLGRTVRAGIYDVEVPIGGESGVDLGVESSTESYGTVNDCALTNGRDPYTLMELTQDEMFTISKQGGLYLEKYLRIIPKSFSNLQTFASPDQQESSPQYPPPSGLPSDVMNINEFVDYLKSIDIPDEVNISDWFGNATLSQGNTKYEGSIGIKFGIRLCYVSRKEMYNNFNLLERPDFPEIFQTCKKEKSFFLAKDRPLSIPLVSYERDVLDEKLASFKEADENFNQDIKCYIDELVKTQEFDLLFNKIFNAKQIGSVLACYSDVNFLASIGLGEGERREPDLGALNLFGLGIEDIPDETDRSNSFNDSKYECRKLFVSVYKRNDFDPPNEEDDVDDLSLATQKALAKSYALVNLDDDVSWWIRRRIVSSKPTDKEGKRCGNQFTGLFNIKR